jgi:hypothetical protein
MTYSIIHDEVLHVRDDYQGAKRRIHEVIPGWQDVISFDDQKGDIHFKTEGPLIPENNGKIPILIILSNPHPHSVRQGMFLSPNRIARPNPFLSTLRESGHFRPLADISAKTMITNQYESHFRIFMAVLISFPSNDPKDLTYIFGRLTGNELIKTGCTSLGALVKENNIRHIICFGRLQYDAVARYPALDSYTSVLKSGGLIRSEVHFAADADVYLTFPTGWRFVKNFSAVKAHCFQNILNHILIRKKERDAGCEKIINLSPSKEVTMTKKIWFVVHHVNLWDIDNKMIGFWNPEQVNCMNIDDVVIYYRAGRKKIMRSEERRVGKEC